MIPLGLALSLSYTHRTGTIWLYLRLEALPIVVCDAMVILSSRLWETPLFCILFFSMICLFAYVYRNGVQQPRKHSNIMIAKIVFGAMSCLMVVTLAYLFSDGSPFNKDLYTP